LPKLVASRATNRHEHYKMPVAVDVAIANAYSLLHVSLAFN
jgi:hypothetical protein